MYVVYIHHYHGNQVQIEVSSLINHCFLGNGAHNIQIHNRMFADLQ